MSQNEWTVEQEICRIAGCSTFSTALRELGILSWNVEQYSIRKDPQKWVRGGAETYVYKFEIEPKPGTTSMLIMKACVAFSVASPMDSILREWISRRNILAAAGASVPRLYGYKNVVLIEEFIRYPIKQVLTNTSRGSCSLLLLKLAELAGIYSRLRFVPIDPFADLRSRGEDVVVIDFGEDLGPQRTELPESSEVFTVLLKTLDVWGIQVDQGTFYNMRQCFTVAAGT